MPEEKKQPYSYDDIAGEATLDVISLANRFNKWMFSTIQPYCKGKVFEVGSGIGNISQFFLEAGFSVQLSDLRDDYCTQLSSRFRSHENLLGIAKVDLVSPEFEVTYSEFIGTFDTVVALNVVEHIENDYQALANAKKLLKPGGRLVVLVPSYPLLYNKFDTELGHYKRYTKKSMRKVFKKAGVRVIHTQYFNLMGIMGWYVSGSLSKDKTIPQKQMQLFNKLVPAFKVVDKLSLNSIGLSTIVIGEKEA